MKATQKFIEDAIEGGWKKDLQNLPNSYYEIETLTRKQGDVVGVWFYYTELDPHKFPVKKSIEILISEILMDKNAWGSVAETRNWKEKVFGSDPKSNNINIYPKYWHRFIDCIILGKSFEQALDSITLTTPKTN